MTNQLLAGPPLPVPLLIRVWIWEISYEILDYNGFNVKLWAVTVGYILVALAYRKTIGHRHVRAPGYWQHGNWKSDICGTLPEKQSTLKTGHLPGHAWLRVIICLVVSTPLKNISQMGVLFPIYGKIKNVPNHQPVMIMSQTWVLPRSCGTPNLGLVFSWQWKKTFFPRHFFH